MREHRTLQMNPCELLEIRGKSDARISGVLTLTTFTVVPVLRLSAIASMQAMVLKFSSAKARAFYAFLLEMADNVTRSERRGNPLVCARLTEPAPTKAICNGMLISVSISKEHPTIEDREDG